MHKCHQQNVRLQVARKKLLALAVSIQMNVSQVILIEVISYGIACQPSQSRQPFCIVSKNYLGTDAIRHFFLSLLLQILNIIVYKF